MLNTIQELDIDTKNGNVNIVVNNSFIKMKFIDLIKYMEVKDVSISDSASKNTKRWFHAVMFLVNNIDFFHELGGDEEDNRIQKNIFLSRFNKLFLGMAHQLLKKIN